MKLINKSNFISIVCTSFTLIVCGKLLLEKLSGFKDKYYTENIFTCLAFSIVITLILSLHYYLQRFPFIPVFIGQYVVTIGIVFLETLPLSSIFSDSTCSILQLLIYLLVKKGRQNTYSVDLLQSILQPTFLTSYQLF